MLQPFCETNIIFVNLYFILYMHLYIIFKVYSIRGEKRCVSKFGRSENI